MESVKNNHDKSEALELDTNVDSSILSKSVVSEPCYGNSSVTNVEISVYKNVKSNSDANFNNVISKKSDLNDPVHGRLDNNFAAILANNIQCNASAPHGQLLNRNTDSNMKDEDGNLTICNNEHSMEAANNTILVHSNANNYDKLSNVLLLDGTNVNDGNFPIAEHKQSYNALESNCKLSIDITDSESKLSTDSVEKLSNEESENSEKLNYDPKDFQDNSSVDLDNLDKISIESGYSVAISSTSNFNSSELNGVINNSLVKLNDPAEKGNDTVINNYEETTFNNQDDYSSSLPEIGTCITKLGSESITCMSDCTKVIFEAVCVDNSVLSEVKSNTEMDQSSVSCYMQTVVEGELQSLNINCIQETNQIKKDSALFAVVSEELTKIDSASEPEVEGFVVRSVESVTQVNDDYYKENVHLINLTEPPPVNIEPDILKQNYISLSEIDEERPDLKDDNDKYDFEKYPNNFCMPKEGKHFLLKVLPLKNGHGLWCSSDLHVAIAERGSVLLRLCAAPEAGDEDLIEGPQADFSALLLHDKLKDSDFDNRLEPNDEIDKKVTIIQNCTNNEDDDERIFAPPIVIETPKPHLPPSLISRQDFMERLQRPESPHFYEELPLTLKWKARNAVTTAKKRKCLSIPFTSVYRSKSNSVPLTPRGRRRGRPPLHNRGLIHNQLDKKKKFIQGPIKFRPPTPPSFLFSEESKDSVADGKSLPKKSFDPRTTCPSLAGVKKAAPGSILSKQNQALKIEKKKNDLRYESISEVSDDFLNTDTENTVKKVSIPCQYCDSIFRKKSALTSHLKMRHRLLRKCPICQEVVRIKEKFGMKYHILEAHSDGKSFLCKHCDETFKLHDELKNHTILAHEKSESNAENSGESCSESDLKISRKSDTNSRPDEPKKSKNYNSKVSNLKGEKHNKISKAKDSTLLFIEDSDSKESVVVSSEGRTRLRSRRSTVENIQTKLSMATNITPKSKEESSSSESGNESDDEGEEDSSGSSDSEVEEPKKYFCSQCDEGFSHLFKLKHHHKEKHSFSRAKEEESASDDDDEVTEDDEGQHSCKICDKKCKNKYQLRLHNLQHNLTRKQMGQKTKGLTITSDSVDNLLRSTRNSVQNSDSHLVRPNLRTNKLGKSSIVNNIDLQSKSSASNSEDNDYSKSKNIGNSNKSKNFEGSNKSKSFGDKNRPTYIVRRGRMYCCTKCNLNFKREKSMTYHLKKVHETLYPFRACPHCSRVFRSCGPYVRHLSQHTGKRCPVDGCKAKYKVLRLIKKHQRHAHPDKPYRCTRCIDLFDKELDLQNHMETAHIDKIKDGDDDSEDGEEDEEEDCDEKIVEVKKICIPNKRKEMGKLKLKPDEETNLKGEVDMKNSKLLMKRKLGKLDDEDVEKELKIIKKTGSIKIAQKMDKLRSKLEEEEVIKKKFVDKNVKLAARHKNTKLDYEELDDYEGEVKNEKKISKQKFQASTLKQKKSKVNDEHLPTRRSRAIQISYKEDDDTDDPIDTNTPPNLLSSPKNLSPSIEQRLSQTPVKNSSQLPSENKERNAFCDKPQPVKCSSESISPDQVLSPASTLTSTNFTVPVVRQKRPYNRKVPYNKKRQDISWTAALKAKYGLAIQNNSIAVSTTTSLSESPVDYSPTITADVVRRVAESLLNRHQEQQQKLLEKQQKRLKKQQKKKIKLTALKFSSASTLPRIPYGSHLNSRDDSLSSFGDSSHTDQLSDYCGNSLSTVNKVPDVEDGSPAKVIRFDSF